MTMEDISPKRTAKRTAKGKAVKYGSDEDEENIDENESDYVGSDSETEKKVKKSKSKTKPTVNPLNQFCHFLSFSLGITREEECFECSDAKSTEQRRTQSEKTSSKSILEQFFPIEEYFQAKKDPSATATASKKPATTKRPKPSVVRRLFVDEEDERIAMISSRIVMKMILPFFRLHLMRTKKCEILLSINRKSF